MYARPSVNGVGFCLLSEANLEGGGEEGEDDVNSGGEEKGDVDDIDKEEAVIGL